jgi:hypothetical protein
LIRTYSLFFIEAVFAAFSFAEAQKVQVKVLDADTGRPVPFSYIAYELTGKKQFTDPQGWIKLEQGANVSFRHPLYLSKSITITKENPFEVLLEPNTNLAPIQIRYQAGLLAIQEHQKNLNETYTPNKYSHDYLTYSNILLTEKPEEEGKLPDTINEIDLIEKRRFLLPDKNYAKIVSARYADGDTSTVGIVPTLGFHLSDKNEYIRSYDVNYYNPLFKNAERRYEYVMLDTLDFDGIQVYAIYFKPKDNKRFVSLSGILFLTGKRFELWKAHYWPTNKGQTDFLAAYDYGISSKNTRYIQKIALSITLNNVPRNRRKSLIHYKSKSTAPNFEVGDESNAKWLEMAIFDEKEQSSEDNTWMMQQVVDRNKLEFIEKDTVDKKLITLNTLKWLYYLYDGKIGYRGSFFDLNNVFAINRFEAVRIGLGIQSHENLSDWFTFGGYIGYGFKDGGVKYGVNVGAYLDRQRKSLFSLHIARDLLEPGLVKHLQVREDLVRNFFTSRMDDYQSEQITFRTKLSAYLTAGIDLNNYTLQPFYDYRYNIEGTENQDPPQTFRFTETTLLAKIGSPFSEDQNLRKILYRKRALQGNFYLRATKGWVSSLGGQYDYWKLNGMVRSNLRIGHQSELGMVVDAGIMTIDQPYQINFGTPGTEFKFTGIIIKNAFQTMQLYDFFTDRYINSFLDYNVGNVLFRKSKYKPELSFALNVGWGRLKGSKEIHELITVQDYTNGYVEGGIVLNNLLRLKIYRYFYGGLGLGTYVGYGPGADNGAFAVRISYEVGAL